MEIIFCIMIFCMGAVFGSFFTLAVYRLPLGLDITHERSFCPKCNHRLEFIDLIPIFSYLSLKGKCRYCGEPVRIRYLLLEVISGLVFLTAYFAFKLTFPFFEITSVSLMIAFVMFYVTNAIILGIDKEYKMIDKRVLLFGIITNTIYMLYLYTFKNVNLYRYGIYLAIILVLFVCDVRHQNISNDMIINANHRGEHCSSAKRNQYLIEILMLLVYEFSFINNLKIIVSMLIVSTIIAFLYKIVGVSISHQQQNNINVSNYEKNVKSSVGASSARPLHKNKIPVGFCISLASITTFLIFNLI